MAYSVLSTPYTVPFSSSYRLLSCCLHLLKTNPCRPLDQLSERCTTYLYVFCMHVCMYSGVRRAPCPCLCVFLRISVSLVHLCSPIQDPKRRCALCVKSVNSQALATQGMPQRPRGTPKKKGKEGKDTTRTPSWALESIKKRDYSKNRATGCWVSVFQDPLHSMRRGKVSCLFVTRDRLRAATLAADLARPVCISKVRRECKKERETILERDRAF